jgi:hypothetical protein
MESKLKIQARESNEITIEKDNVLSGFVTGNSFSA